LISRQLISAALAALVLGGCATAKNPGPAPAKNPVDPFESVNRGIYRLNDRVDKAVVRPTARVYQRAVPQFVRQSVSNVFSNIGDVRVGLNNALQGKFAIAYSDFGRVMMNSTIGVLGLFDIASEAGIERHQEDFGQTLGWWGLPDGPFIMLPIFGPSTVRDTAGFAVDYLTDPLTYVEPTRAQNQLTAGKLVNGRAELLDASKVLDTVALDQYQFVRDAYLQRRRSLVYDGKPPAEKDAIRMPPKEGPPGPDKPAGK
jgi:phospholipid-binding lipoprotein MlaA